MNRIYLEYFIKKDRPGLLGDIASILGLLKINILTISSIDSNKRGFLLSLPEGLTEEFLASFLERIEDLQISFLKKPHLLDYLALKHGERIEENLKTPPLYSFRREQIHILIDFIGSILKREKAINIGFKGEPRVGKTESAIASCVLANKGWALISSTLLHKTAKTSLSKEAESDKVLLFDALTTMDRSSKEHKDLVLYLLKRETIKIIEHPDIFIHEGIMNKEDFHLFVELFRGSKRVVYRDRSSFNSFDIS